VGLRALERLVVVGEAGERASSLVPRAGPTFGRQLGRRDAIEARALGDRRVLRDD
jgi:hypothetical protein